MRAWRSQLFPHVLLLLLLLVASGTALVRLNQAAGPLARLERQTEWVEAAFPHLAEIEILVSRLQYARGAWTGALDASPPADLAATAAALDQRLQRLAAASPPWRDELYFSQLLSSTRALKRALRSGDGVDAASRVDHVSALWSDVNSGVAQKQAETARLLAAMSRRLYREACGGVVVVSMLMVLYLILVHVLVSRPLQQLAATARAVTAGDLRARAPTGGNEQVAGLAGDFNDMVAILVRSLYEEEQAAKQLRARTRELEAANRHKSHFLANVSHELKTPLSAIIGFADILAAGHRGDLNPNQLDYLRRILSAGEHLLSMISDLIDLAKLDLGALSLTPTDFDLATTLEEAVDMLVAQAQRREQTLRFQPPRPPIQLKTDPRRLKQVVVNLLSNAVKFTPDGGRIELRAERAGERVAISVTDTGVGIEEAARERIFEDFVQLDSELRRRHEGTGIGLPLSRRLVALMGGEIQVRSSVGKGSSFRVLLPRESPDSATFRGSAAATADGKDGKPM